MSYILPAVRFGESGPGKMSGAGLYMWKYSPVICGDWVAVLQPAIKEMEIRIIRIVVLVFISLPVLLKFLIYYFVTVTDRLGATFISVQT